MTKECVRGVKGFSLFNYVSYTIMSALSIKPAFFAKPQDCTEEKLFFSLDTFKFQEKEIQFNFPRTSI